MKKAIIIIVVIILVAVGIYLFARDTSIEPVMNNEIGENSSDVPQESAEDEVQTYTLAQIAEHNTAEDCWMAIEGKVYDVTPFIASGRHPGGAAIVEGCGTDATILFNTRPMGSGTPHSQTARNNLVNFYIGELAQ